MINEKEYLEYVNSLRVSALKNYIPVMREKSLCLLLEKVKEQQPKNILEIGTAVGCSGALMLLNSENATLTTIEKDENSISEAKKTFKTLQIEDRVNLLCGDAFEVLSDLKNKNFQCDFIFLDGAKGQYFKYLPILADMLKVNGTMVADNVLYRGMVNGETPIQKNKKTLVLNLRKFLENLQSDKRFKTELLNLEDGLTISVKMNK